MNSNRSTSDADTSQPIEDAMASGPVISQTCYVEAAPVFDVIEDQLHYLVNHGAGRRCFAACPDCARLREVTRILLKPFA